MYVLRVQPNDPSTFTVALVGIILPREKSGMSWFSSLATENRSINSPDVARMLNGMRAISLPDQVSRDQAKS